MIRSSDLDRAFHHLLTAFTLLENVRSNYALSNGQFKSELNLHHLDIELRKAQDEISKFKERNDIVS